MSPIELKEYIERLDGREPSFSEFNPTFIPYQLQVIEDIKHNFDYSFGAHVVLLSGSVGSAKSILMAHLAIRHCIEHPGATCLLGRKALPDLKETIFKEILDHLSGSFVESNRRDFSDGGQYYVNESTAFIAFANGSRIISRSWHDRKYKKFRSLKLSMAILEELVENDDEDKQAFKEIRMRLGRIPHVCRNENLLLAATNPDSPSHWVYDDIIKKAQTSRLYHVYYSLTDKNPFLPKEYVESLSDEMDEKEADRMLRGLWIEIKSETIYHNYTEERNFVDRSYEPEFGDQIHITWDFNVALGKPLSLTLFIYDGSFHFFNEVIVERIDTEDACAELAARGLLDYPCHYIINGDATARATTTKSKGLKSDYDIIEKYLSNYRTREGGRLSFAMAVPKSNPFVKERHNRVRAYMRSDSGKTRLFVYRDCPMLNKGFKLTALKKGGQYIEDDSKDFQHVTTAAGYGICYVHKRMMANNSGLRSVKYR